MAVQAQAQAQPPRHRFTKDDYHRMGEVGILGEDDRVELIDGEIIDMPPIGDEHVGGVNSLTDLLVRLVGQEAVVSVQNPVRLPGDSEPQPDFALIRRGTYRRGVPAAADVQLIIEVSDTTLAYDRNRKVPLYAAAGIPEVWIVDVAGGAIERYTEPREGAYGSTFRAHRGQTIASTVLPNLVLPVDTVLG
ncbi:MAG: Uma2 family endonuclease [Chloroflexota bacterium]|nr:Uma2 family endonuclease [Chloroflexota bacterium]